MFALISRRPGFGTAAFFPALCTAGECTKGAVNDESYIFRKH